MPQMKEQKKSAEKEFNKMKTNKQTDRVQSNGCKDAQGTSEDLQQHDKNLEIKKHPARKEEYNFCNEDHTQKNKQ